MVIPLCARSVNTILTMPNNPTRTYAFANRPLMSLLPASVGRSAPVKEKAAAMMKAQAFLTKQVLDTATNTLACLWYWCA